MRFWIYLTAGVLVAYIVKAIVTAISRRRREAWKIILYRKRKDRFVEQNVWGPMEESKARDLLEHLNVDIKRNGLQGVMYTSLVMDKK